jgi:hypothetical protein
MGSLGHWVLCYTVLMRWARNARFWPTFDTLDTSRVRCLESCHTTSHEQRHARHLALVLQNRHHCILGRRRLTPMTEV